jgi:hypothetical protein
MAYFTQSIIASVGLSTMITGVLIFMARTFIGEKIKSRIQAEYQEKLERLKLELQSAANLQLERIRTDLKISAAEREFRFQRLHERRIDILADVYGKLRVLYDSMRSYVQSLEVMGDPPKEDKFKAMHKAYYDFYNAHAQKAIFFPADTAGHLEAIDRSFVINANMFRTFVQSGRYPEEAMKRWAEIENRVESEIKTAMNDLASEFRQLISEAT